MAPNPNWSGPLSQIECVNSQQILLISSISDCYQDEIAPQLGKYCKDHYDKVNICNGTKNDCVLKGKEMCGLDPNCYGIMYDTEWAEAYKGVKICSSWTLEEKPEKDWSVFLKCRPGKLFIGPTSKILRCLVIVVPHVNS